MKFYYKNIYDNGAMIAQWLDQQMQKVLGSDSTAHTDDFLELCVY